MLQLLLLGAPHVRLNGRPVSGFVTSKAEALLFYLAATARPHTRTALASLLWPDMPEVNARKNLRDVIVSLRKLVGDYLSITNQALAMNQQTAHWVDVASFRAALTNSQAVSLNELREALGLYRGEFLEGFQVLHAYPFVDWLEQQRQECRQLIISGLHELADRFLARGEYGSALTATRRLLMVEAWDETAHRKQMLLLALSQQRTAALVQYQICVQALADELQLQPSSETVTLYEQIRDSHFDQKLEAQDELYNSAYSSATPSRTMRADKEPPPHNLPRQLTPMIGRAIEVASVRDKLIDPTCALVTITGVDGVGKTRLALAVAQMFVDAENGGYGGPGARQAAKALPTISDQPFKDGIWFISLAGLAATENFADQLAAQTAHTLAIPFTDTGSLQAQLLEQLREKRLLLIYDNFEQMPKGVEFILAFLQAVHGAKVLVTARQRLRLQAESVFRLEGLALPSIDEVGRLSNEQLLAYPAFQLFIERAGRISTGFQLTTANQIDIFTICQRVDGLPLGIELAAAQVEQYSLAGIVERLNNSYHGLVSDYSDLPTRQQNMHALLATSWQQLTDTEKCLLMQCAVFCGGFTAEAAAVVMDKAPALLAGLIDQSLLSRNEAGRYTLHEPMRQYAVEQLAAATNEFAEQVRKRHCAYFANFLHQGETEADLLFQMTVRQEIDNIRTAWQWATEQRCLALLTRSLPGLFKFYELAGFNQEALTMVRRTITHVRTLLAETTPPTTEQQRLLAQLLIEQSHFASKLTRVEEFEALAEEVIELGRQLADHEIQIKGYEHLSRAAWLRGKIDSRLATIQQFVTLAQASGRIDLEVQGLNLLGICYTVRENYALAQAWLRRARRAAEHHGLSALESRIYLNLGYLAEQRGNFRQVLVYYEEALRRNRQLDKPQEIGIALHFLGRLYMRLGAYTEARNFQTQSLVIFQQIGYRYYESHSFLLAAFLAHATDDVGAAHDFAKRALFLAQEAGFYAIEGEALFCLGEILVGLQQYRQAQALYQQALRVLYETGERQVVRRTQASLARLFLLQKELDAAQLQITEFLQRSTEPLAQSAVDGVTVAYICYQVLEATHDPCAQGLLQDAYQQLQVQAATISNEKLRQSFLEEAPFNRAIIAAYQRQPVGR